MDHDRTLGGRTRAAVAERRTRGVCAHELFEAQARATPDATALTFEGRSLSYGELNRRADRLANDLRRLGVGPGILVGHCLGRGPGMVVGVLGVMKAGGAYVPLDAGYPEHRLRFMLQDSAVGVLLTERRLLGSLPEHRARVLLLDGDREATEACAVSDSGRKPRPSDLAYVIYTSGTTGQPKGVEVPHSALVNFLTSMRRRPAISARDVLLAVTTLSFDIAVLELLLPLTVGARCEIAGRDVITDGESLAASLAGSGATVMQATPATWLMLLEAGWEGSGSLKALCGGEAMSRELADRLLPRCGSLWNMYGPTEATVWATVERVGSGGGPVPLGRPIDNTRVHILGPGMQPVAVGREGELHIGGDGLARGYLNRPGLTAERFVPDPFSPRPGARLYRTGDLARYRPDGGIEFLGRLDHQVKIRGFRIEPGEIDAMLARHPAVRRSVTLAREDRPGERRLVSYVVPGGSRGDAAPPATARLRGFLEARLPDYMVPSAFVMLDALPLTPNGKVDRDSLPAPGHESVRRETPYVAPRDELDAELVAIWEDVFGMRPLGIEDDFFHLGGHSLLALQLVTRVERSCGRRFPLPTLARTPTVRLLADLVKQTGSGTRRSSLVEVQAGGDEPPFFCLPGGTGIVDGLGTLALRHLAELLGPGRPVLTFQSGSSGSDAPEASSIEEMASDFVRDLLARYPDGPYYLGGYSHGAYVALEMACRLREGGRPVGLVALWGVNFPAVLPRLRRWRRKRFAEMRTRLSDLGMPTPEVDPRLPRFERLVDTYRQSLASRCYHGPVTLLLATEPMDSPGFCFDEPHNGCLSLAREVRVWGVPGDHLTIMREPNVRALAEGLKSLLSAGRPAAPALPTPDPSTSMP